ncbi:hypothetical protein ALC53_10184 [Atta colombica]|uniref:Uncharacterized protein n=1 Tax=Atta colombica TaxID=520822 RepID=A0A195B5C4_9HYME|nr:hypothetical protein ALC53_10184 [Atta colombica]
MWDKFGVTKIKINIRRPTATPWFFSDFPHLIKCLRNKTHMIRDINFLQYLYMHGKKKQTKKVTNS